MNEVPEPPISVAEGHDITVFNSVGELRDYVEPVDVDDGVYEAWDARGRRIDLYVESEEIELALLPGGADQADQLMKLLTEMIHRVGPERYRQFRSEGASLSELLEVVLDFQEHGSVNRPAPRLRQAFSKWFGTS